MSQQSYTFFDLHVFSRDADSISQKVWDTVPGVLGVEETNEKGESFQTISPEFDILEFGTEAARKSSEYFETRNNQSNSKIFVRVYIDASDEQVKDACIKEFESWQKDGEILGYRMTSKQNVDYFAEFKKTFKGRNLNSDIWIGPPWDKPTQETLFCFVVEPGMAFGTGDHPTTQMCIERLWELYREGFQPKRILDLGTGTGVLAIACRKFFPDAKIIAVDLDPQCETNFLVNCEHNNLSPNSLDYRFGEVAGNVKNQTGSFDLIVSNIYAEVLAFLYPDIDRLLGANSKWVSSGILEGNSEKSLRQKVSLHLETRNTRSKDGDQWVMLSYLKN